MENRDSNRVSPKRLPFIRRSRIHLTVLLLAAGLTTLVACADSNALTQQELDQFQTMFTDPQRWDKPFLPMFLSSQYPSPEEIDLGWFFREGVPNQEPDSSAWGYSISQEEMDALRTVLDEETYQWYLIADIYKTPRPVAEALLEQYLGLSLEETDQVGLSRLHYLPEYDAFYSAARDTAIVLPHFTAGTWRKDGTVELIYHDKLECFRENCDTPEEVYSLVLTPWENGWHLVSNTQIAPQSP